MGGDLPHQEMLKIGVPGSATGARAVDQDGEACQFMYHVASG